MLTQQEIKKIEERFNVIVRNIEETVFTQDGALCPDADRELYSHLGEGK